MIIWKYHTLIRFFDNNKILVINIESFSGSNMLSVQIFWLIIQSADRSNLL